MPNNHDEDFYSPEDPEGDHIDEKWLISYADMMTLLFGFFVMMYVLSTSNKAKMEETLQKISQEGFLAEVKPSDSPKPVVTNMVKTAPATDDILIEIKKLEEKKKREVEDILIQAKTEAVKNEEELKAALENLKKIEEEKLVLIQEKAETEKRAKESEEKAKELERTSEEKSLKVKSVEDDQVRKLKKNLKDLELGLKLNEVKNKEISKENALLKQQIKNMPKINDDDHFMMVFVQWDTEKHDIDMVIEDPKGNLFNYKKRSMASVAGEFVVDSTYGPGVESWVTNKTIEGTYKVTFRFYNQYGNKKDAVIKPSVFNNLKVEKLPPITLNFAKKREKTIFIKVANDGQFTVTE